MLFCLFYDIITAHQRTTIVDRFFYACALCTGFFVITKGVYMQKVSYMGDGENTDFTFNFPYFENTDVVVTKNGEATTGYNIIGNSAGLDADIPYTGGTVVFETAPSVLDNIVIARNLPHQRQYDYQPTVKIDPTTLNQDLNYLMEVIKDLQDELDSLSTQYSEIADKESTTTLLARISAIHDEIVAVSAQITALGNISTLRSDVATNTENITTLDNRTTGLLDYVIASQAPTAENNYTWYRKYKSGWVEQGGQVHANTEGIFVGLPITMDNATYVAQISNSTSAYASNGFCTSDRTTTGFKAWCSYTQGRNAFWEVKGIAA